MLWQDDNDDARGTRPASVTVRLYADGEFAGKTLAVRPDADGNWSGKFAYLYRYAGGEEIGYAIAEDPVDDYVLEGIEGSAAEGFEISNRYHPYGDLRVAKVLADVEGMDKALGNEFVFTLRLTAEGEDGEPVPVVDRYRYTITDQDGNTSTGEIGNGGDFVLKGGESILIEDIPTSASYEIAEAGKDGFELAGASNASGKAVSWTETEAVFANRYVTRGYARLEASKALDGRALRGYQFQFGLYDMDGNLVRTGYNDAAGLVDFGRIGYSNADAGMTYTYRIAEIDGGRDGYSYDGAEYYADVSISDNGDGTMTCDIEYYRMEGGERVLLEDGEGNPALPAFHNEYRAEGSLSFKAWKTLDLRDPEDGEFSFALYGTDGDGNPDFSEPIGIASNDADGVIGFEAIDYDQDDIGNTYLYFVRELKGEEPDPAIVYTDMVLCYAVEVADNGDGTLGFGQSAYDATCTACGGEGRAEADCPDCGGTGAIEDADCAACGGSGKAYYMFYNCSKLSTSMKITPTTLALSGPRIYIVGVRMPPRIDVRRSRPFAGL